MKNILMAGLIALQASIALARSPEVIGGTVQNRADFPEVVQLVVNDGRGLCSGTIVGPQVLLTAGHCAADGETVQVNLADGTTTFATCSLSPQAGQVEAQAHDVNLCLLFDEQQPAKFGTIDETPVNLRDFVTIAGFGCTNDNDTGGNDGQLRTGDAVVTHTVGTGDADAFDFQTTAFKGVVCPGDSGGPDFRKNTHQVVALNSKVSVLQQSPIKFGKDSFLTAMSTQASKDFLRSFAAQHGVQICGVNASCP